VAGGPERAKKAAEAAVACPLLEGIDLSGARGVLVLIAAAKSTFRLMESKTAMNTIRMYAADDAHVIYGAAFDETLGDQMRVTVIATGLSSVARSKSQGPGLTVVPTPMVQPVLRTGTNDVPVLSQPIAGHPAGSPVAATGLQSGDFSGLQAPSVWRNARTKVDSLQSSGMDEIEIPAFLRKQAD
jgi:cell division protein FtsZ